MASSNMTSSNQGQRPAEQVRRKPADINCLPMSHQNSGAHGHEMYPQQFLHLVGCHNAPAAVLRKPQDEKLH